jgi:hypothetical protein
LALEAADAEHGGMATNAYETSERRSTRAGSPPCAGGGAIYVLGVLGAWVYFWQQADGFWLHVWAILQGIIWPAYMVYEAFSALAG